MQLLPQNHRHGSFHGNGAEGFPAPGTGTPLPWLLPCPAGCGVKLPLPPASVEVYQGTPWLPVGSSASPSSPWAEQSRPGNSPSSVPGPAACARLHRAPSSCLPLPAVSPEGDTEGQGRQGTTAILCWLRGSAQPAPGGTEAAERTSIYWLLVILDVAPGLNALMKY